MDAAFTFTLFALDRVRNVLLALALIVLMKAAWLYLLAPALT
ncbi:MAG: hypothetical protein AB7P07_07220 [Hyphomonadaceae bacterium]